jgi:hypothetical protein
LLVREINIGFAASIILLAFLGMSPLASPFAAYVDLAMHDSRPGIIMSFNRV